VQQLAARKQWAGELRRRLYASAPLSLIKKRHRLHGATTLLEAMSPLAVLGRGYAVVRSGPAEKPPGELIRSFMQVAIGKQLEVILQDGKIDCEVTQVRKGKRNEGA
jgi:exodeoxyribonuclease VII large subunit